MTGTRGVNTAPDGTTFFEVVEWEVAGLSGNGSLAAQAAAIVASGLSLSKGEGALLAQVAAIAGSGEFGPGEHPTVDLTHFHDTSYGPQSGSFAGRPAAPEETAFDGHVYRPNSSRLRARKRRAKTLIP